MGLSSPSWCSDTQNNGLELLRSHFGDAKHKYSKPLSVCTSFINGTLGFVWRAESWSPVV